MKRYAYLIAALLALPTLADAQTVLRQSTSRVVRICGVVAVGDGFTPVTSLTLSGADEAEALRDNTATLDISGATFAAVTGADGCYSLTLDTTATNTVGELIVQINDDSLILPVWRTFQVVEEAIYDALYAGSATGLLPANVTQWNGVALSTTNPLPNAAAGASGGLLINGTNTGTSTFGSWTLADFNVTAQVNLADGLDIARSTSNATGLTVAGNGTGNGATFTSGSGATGNGASFVAASTNGNGFAATGAGSGSGGVYTGGASGDGLSAVGGGTSGDGAQFNATAGNGAGLRILGQGIGDGILAASGGGATGNGITANSLATNGHGVSFNGSGSGSGLIATAGTTGEGIEGIGGATSGVGFRVAGTAGNSGGAAFVGQGTGNGATFTSGAGATGNGAQFTSAATNGSGIGLTPTGTGTGINGTLAAVTNLTNAATAGDLTATMKASVKSEVCDTIGLCTTITVTDQDTFTLGAGPTFDDALIGWAVKIKDAGSQDQYLGKIEDYVGSSKTVELNRTSGFTIATGDSVVIYPAFLYEAADTGAVNCVVDTANFAGSATTLACDLTDKDGNVITLANGKWTGKEILITSGAQLLESRYIFSTTWDGTNNELQITLDRALPATLADAVTAIIR